jgi:hypothetical protein
MIEISDEHLIATVGGEIAATTRSRGGRHERADRSTHASQLFTRDHTGITRLTLYL